MADKELTQQEKLRTMVCNDIWAYAQYMLPYFAFGDIHEKVFKEMGDPQRKENMPNLLSLIPRDHLKSVMAATYCTWRIARNPAYTILYITADDDLGKLQMTFMQNIFESDRFRYLFPDHFDPEMGRRSMWRSQAVCTDHQLRKDKNIRDETIACKTIKSGKTGRHPDEIVYDDLVVRENAYTEVGREDVRIGAAAASSLIKSDGLMTAVGTTYHLADQYALWKGAKYEVYDDEGAFVEERALWSVIERQVENAGDGSGTYLWPRTISPSGDGEWYGWDRKAISRKKAEYTLNGELTQFFAQYYMEPNDPGSHRVSSDDFRYAEPKLLEFHDGKWFYAGRLLNIMATMDTAITDASNANAIRNDYTAIMVVGLCTEGYYYVLAMNQFQTDERTVYYKELLDLWKKWMFKRIYIEMEAAGKVVADNIKESLRLDGYTLVVEGSNAPRGIAKHERHASVTIPRYEQNIVHHFKGGYTNELEEQVQKPRPKHDDLLDCITMAIEKLKKPQARGQWTRNRASGDVIVASSRFGGRR